MDSIQTIIEAKADVLTGDGVCEDCIVEAEHELGLKFAPDYRSYLRLYGVAAYDGHELTGLTKSPRVNVVAVTKEAKKNNPNIPQEFYVLEEAGVEEIIVWQATSGEVFCSSPNSSLQKICDSMGDYIIGIF